MDYKSAVKICSASGSSKEQLRGALAWSLNVELKAKPEKEDNSVFNTCKELFYTEYEKYSGLAYTFGAKDGRALASILKKIEKIVTDPAENKVAENTFKIIIERLPEWYRKNAFSLSVIDSKFNEIVTSIKNSNGQPKQPVSTDYKARIVSDLLA